MCVPTHARNARACAGGAALALMSADAGLVGSWWATGAVVLNDFIGWRSRGGNLLGFAARWGIAFNSTAASYQCLLR